MEVMVTAAVLALCTVLIQGGMLRAAHFFGRYANTLKAEIWMDDKIWDVRERSFYQDEETTNPPNSESAHFNDSEKEFNGSVNPVPAPSGKELYALNLSIRWQEGNQDFQVARKVYVTK